MKFKNLTGKKFGRLIAIKQVGKDKKGNYKWLCQCDCEKEKIILGFSLTGGRTKSCGCLNIEIARQRNTIHGHSRKGKITRTYRAWCHMIERCTKSDHRQYENYGGRGIKVCQRWLKFKNFLEDMGECPPGLSIDRTNNNDGYCKQNCRWATINQQNNNTRHNHMITFNNKTQTLTEWAKELKMSTQGLLKRFELGWPIEKALTRTVRKINHGEPI